MLLGLRRFFRLSSDEGTHCLNKISSDCILKECMGPFISLCKFTGVFPVRILEDGSAVFKYFQLPFAFYLAFIGIFTTMSCIYSPFYLDTTKRLTEDRIFAVAKYLFVCGQFIASMLSFVMVPRLCRRVAKFWNGLHQILIVIYKQPMINPKSRKYFIPAYRSARRAICYWVAINISSWYMWNKTFHPFFKGYFGASSAHMYYLAMCGCLIIATLIATHVLHSFIFMLLVSMVRGALKCLREAPLDGPISGFEHKLEIAEAVELYEGICSLIRRLGQIYGRYLIVEMCALFTAVLTNVFALLSGFDTQGVSWETTSVSLIINVFWIYHLCEAGESLKKEQIRCLKSLKNSAVCHKMSEGWMIAKFVSEEPMGISAANYFRISRQLMTQVTGAVVMYLIVMLQFKSTSSSSFLHNIERQQ